MNYETVIGLEVHVQLHTRSKMFCRCSADYASAPPNTHVCPVCLGMPGVLPVINKQALEYTLMTALAMNCTIPGYTKFDRKNYPYPDLMKGYQISQYDAPIGHRGWLNIQMNGSEQKAGITRVHLEEDVAKLLHRASVGETYSLVDVNRSGVPLMEIVGEPDLRSAEEARQYLITLHSILQYLGVSTANMEEGSFRCDANISIRPEGSTELMAKVEVKNMNSFRAVYRALEYEARRQRKLAEAGERLLQETRGWVEAKGVTVSQRSKEYAHDYRYFPEPDLPPLVMEREWVEAIKSKLPELPEARRNRFVAEYGLPRYDANLLTGSKAMADYFEASRKANLSLPAKDISNWLLGPVSAIVNTNNIDMTEFSKKVSPDNLVKLVVSSKGVVDTVPNTVVIDDGVFRPGENTDNIIVVTTGTAKSVLGDMFNTGKSADDIIREKGLSQISDTEEVKEVVNQVMRANAPAVADYKMGKETALKFLVGQVMKATRGRVNPPVAAEILKKKLGEERSANLP